MSVRREAAHDLGCEQAERNYDLNRAAELKYGNLMVLQQQLTRAEAALAARHGNGRAMLREEVTAADISEVISKWTGIPVQALVESEKDKLLHINDVRLPRPHPSGSAGVAGCAAARCQIARSSRSVA